MRSRHHVPYKEDDDFGINASATLMGMWQQLTGSIFAVTIGIVAVFMVVGGIVIMNIMLASVTERTHEIGIRKSLGAKRRDILLQFIIESGVMAAVGGVIGIVLSLVISKIVDTLFTFRTPECRPGRPDALDHGGAVLEHVSRQPGGPPGSH